MLALQKTDPAFGLSLRDVPVPQPGPDEVVVAVRATGVCGTDLHIYEWTPGYEVMTGRMPVTIGHELAGTVTAIGRGVSGLAEGTSVAARPSVVCGRCTACLAGNSDACGNRMGIGISRNGGFAPFVAVPAENCVVVPSHLDPEVAALTEPMTVSAEAVDMGEVRPGDRVLVLGPGSIGQGIALLAREAGAGEVVVVGRNDGFRLDRVRKMGFQDAVDLGDRPLADALEPYLAQGRFDVVIEATGVPAVVQEGLGVLRKRGVLVVCGIHPRPATIDLTRLVREHQQIRGSYRAPLATWPRVVDYLTEHTELARQMITHRVPLADAIAGFDLARQKAVSKLVVFPQA